MNLRTISASTILLAALTLSISAAQAQQAETCELSSTTPVIPDGNVASMDELLAAQSAIKGFQASLGEYRTCLDSQRVAFDPATEEGLAGLAQIDGKYNASVDSEEAVAASFNAAVKAYNARN